MEGPKRPWLARPVVRIAVALGSLAVLFSAAILAWPDRRSRRGDFEGAVFGLVLFGVVYLWMALYAVGTARQHRRGRIKGEKVRRSEAKDGQSGPTANP